jgi:RNA polymerase sigma-70 factor (ECF subfamily)
MATAVHRRLAYPPLAPRAGRRPQRTETALTTTTKHEEAIEAGRGAGPARWPDAGAGARTAPPTTNGVEARTASGPPATAAVLMQRIQAGEHQALGELYDRLAVRAYRTAFAVCRDRDRAQDAVQDAFVSIWSSRALFRPELGGVVPWAMTVVRNRALDLRRREACSFPDDSGLDRRAAPDDVPGDVIARSEADRIAELLSQLPPPQRQVIQLGFYAGYTHAEIARRLGVPPGTVKGRMRLGLTKLRAGLDG